MLESGLLLLAATDFVAYVVRGVTGAASAIVFNALYGLGSRTRTGRGTDPARWPVLDRRWGTCSGPLVLHRPAP